MKTHQTDAGCVWGPSNCVMDEYQPLALPSESCLRPQHFPGLPVSCRRRVEGRRRSWLFHDAAGCATWAGGGGPPASEGAPVRSRGACSAPPSRNGVLVLQLHQAREKVPVHWRRLLCCTTRLVTFKNEARNYSAAGIRIRIHVKHPSVQGREISTPREPVQVARKTCSLEGVDLLCYVPAKKNWGKCSRPC